MHNLAVTASRSGNARGAGSSCNALDDQKSPARLLTTSSLSVFSGTAIWWSITLESRRAAIIAPGDVVEFRVQ